MIDASVATGTIKAGTKRTLTIERAGLILACFSVEEPHLTLGALAEKLGVNQSTVYRYVRTLLAAGLLERDERRGGYRLGLRVVELAYVALNELEVRKHALDEMDALREDLGLMVNLGVLFQGDTLNLAHAAPKGWPRWKTTPGRRGVAHCTGVGKVLLAHRPWEETRRTIEQRGWRPNTSQSIQDFDRLQEELALVRARGYANENEECLPGVACIAMPIWNHAGQVVAALSVTGSVAWFASASPEKALGKLRESANRISVRMGYHGVMAYL